MNSDPDLQQRCRQLAESLGLCKAAQVRDIEPLTGGVASDIARVTLGERQVCMKFALARLKVKEDWFAPVHRGRAEYAWLQTAATVVPDAVPELLGWSDSAGGFAMAYVGGPEVRQWKQDLLDGHCRRADAVAVADRLVRIHAHTSRADFDTTGFDNMDDFEALRLEPYLRFTASRHPAVASALTALADELAAARIALIHGDVSPKNVLLSAGGPVLLDAECATMGDPVFDVAFVLNHLLIKSLHLPAIAASLQHSALAFWQHYAGLIDWEVIEAFETRLTRLLPALMLARIDGKSPLEYLSDAERERIRTLALQLLTSPSPNLRSLIHHRLAGGTPA